MQDQIDPAIFDQILAGGQQSANLDPQIAQQQALATRLRLAGQTPGLMDAGRRIVAPSKLAYLGAMANNIVAGQRDQQVAGMQRQKADIGNQQVQQILAYLRARQQGPIPAPSSGGPAYGDQSAPTQGAENY